MGFYGSIFDIKDSIKTEACQLGSLFFVGGDNRFIFVNRVVAFIFDIWYGWDAFSLD